jgi:cytochrome b pre-mRNA-processing protein 3
MFLFKKRDSRRRQTIERLYGAIVAQARQPAFYEAFGVPDTVEGRFDLLVLHLHLVNDRLTQEGEAGVALGQELLDRFFEDMDASLREIGIGDLAVPKKIRSMAEAYLGRSASYAEAISKGDAEALAAAVARNILGGSDVSAAMPLARYAIEAARRLRAQNVEQLSAANIEFPVPLKAAAHAG